MFRSLGRFITSAILLLLAGLSMACARYLGTFFFPAYRQLSQRVLHTISSVTGLLPFALWEVLLALLLLFFIYSIFHTIFQKKRCLSWLSGVVLTLSVLVFLFVALWGLNHYAPPISEELGLDVREYSQDELTAATAYYMQEAAALAAEVPRSESGELTAPDFKALAAVAETSYQPLAAQHSVFGSGVQPVKASCLTTAALNYSGTTGIFLAFTAESTVNPDTFAASLPHTMCHEIAHSFGIAAEDEANFAAFLACDASSDTFFRYSGYYDAFLYCYNALYDADAAAAKALWNDSTALLQQDCTAANAHYAPYAGKVQDTAQKLNDGYLKAFSEESGVQSYGEAADYLIAWYLQKNA